MPASLDFRAMGCPCSIVVDALPSDEVQSCLLRGEEEVRRIEQKFSRYRAESVTGRINAAAGITAVDCDAETATLLNLAGRLHADTDGLFDITSGVLRKAWDFSRPCLPDAEVLKGLLGLVGWGRVQWDGQRIYLPRTGMEIDLGGFGKEYA